MSALTPIDQVIRQLCRETGEPDYKNYDTILTHVRGALVDLQLFVLPSVKTTIVSLSKINNIDWPSDCVKPVLIGLIRGGKVCNISVDSGAPQAENNDCSNMSEVESNIQHVISADIDPYTFYGHQVYGGSYDKIKACTHDKENRISNIKFKLIPGDKIQFTYISDGISGGVSHVPIEAETAIGEWVFYKYYRRTSPSLSDRARDRYKEEFTRLRKFFNDETLEDWIKAIVRR